MTRLQGIDYTVGWICALPNPEWKASRLLFDGEHDDPPDISTHFEYAYGDMNGHNVVMGCLPDTMIGLSSAAAVAQDMQSKFTRLRFVLLVGIGGGVPSSRSDIRLGDVVVSRPDRDKGHGGVIQYDFGKSTAGGGFEQTGILHMPPNYLLSVLGKVQSARPESSKFHEYLQSFHQRREDAPEFSNPPTTDRLFEATYTHPAKQPTCRDCDTNYEIPRPLRSNHHPRIHYGTIASGNRVIKDAFERDRVSQQQGDVLCFEMEAAGLMTVFPCLIVRGICDYCDSHKNKSWQPFAAAAAAAWAKELLRNVKRKEETDTRITTELSPQSNPSSFTSTSRETVNMLPYDQDQHFVGRASTLRELHEALMHPQRHTRAAIAGLGGVGKSQIAIEYGWQVARNYDKVNIFWVHASSPERFLNDYQSIATRLTLPGFRDPQVHHLTIVTEWLKSEESGRWLLIVDNADDQDFARGWRADLPRTAPFTLPEHLPRKPGCSILITSRDRHAAFALVGDNHCLIDLQSMTEIEAVDLFEKKTAARQWDTVQAHRLAVQLDCLPLAITQAAAFIMQRQRMTISLYLERFQHNEEGLLSESENDLRRDPNVPNSVIKTWEISFRQIKMQNVKAAELLYCLAFLEKQGIPDWLIFSSKSDEADYDDALETLIKFGFVCYRPSDREQTLEMHRLVQLATRVWIRENDKLELWSLKTLQMVYQKYPSLGYENWQISRILEPHAESAIAWSYSVLELDRSNSTDTNHASHDKGKQAVNSTVPLDIVLETRRSRGMLLYNRAMYIHYQGRFMDAVEMAKRAQTDLQHAFGDRDANTLNCGNLVASSYYSAGLYRDAATVGVDVVEKQRDCMGAEHPDTLTSMCIVALSYRGLGWLDQAMEILIDVNRMFLTIPAGQLKPWLMSRNALAMLHGDMGAWQKKEQLEIEIVEILTEVGSEFDPDRLAAMHNLAQTYQMQNRLKSAEDLLTHVRQLNVENMGKDHPNSISSMTALASIYFSQERFDEALQIQREAIEEAKKAPLMGRSDPGTLDYMFNLASMLRVLEQPLEAERILKKCSKLRNRRLGPDHVDSIHAREALREVRRVNQASRDEISRLLSRIDWREATQSCVAQIQGCPDTKWPEEGEEEAQLPASFEFSDEDAEEAPIPRSFYIQIA